jgi:hypothetical protein
MKRVVEILEKPIIDAFIFSLKLLNQECRATFCTV